MRNLFLRPHHLLCLRFFEGKGYSKDFIRHMYSLTKLLLQDPVITIVQGCDAVCSACPHNASGFCHATEKIDTYDKNVLSALGIAVGDHLPWRKLCTLTDERIIHRGSLAKICCDCQWLPLCENRQAYTAMDAVSPCHHDTINTVFKMDVRQ